MREPDFVHLRVHSEYTITDSIVRVDSLVAAAAADAQPAVAITDLGNLFGWIKFYKQARAAGVKPILGVDCWLSNDADRGRPYRLTLLARDHAGYLSLCALISRAWLGNEYRGRAELRAEWFDESGGTATGGLIALSGAQWGEVGQALLARNHAAAEEAARCWARRFPGAYYLEVQRFANDEAELQTREAARLAAELGLPIVATHPVQFIAPNDFDAHEARVCIAEGEMLANPRRQRRFTKRQYLLSQAEMCEAFADLPCALANSVEIAKRCNLEMTLGKAQLPQFPIPPGATIDGYLRELARAGLARRLEKLFADPAALATNRARYDERLEYECEMIVQMGFAGYFLIVADFINWAKNNGVPVGPGRGSGAGSLVAYALGVTDIDPIPYSLLFERFLNPERVSMPDFDIDFCQDNRYKVIDYVRQRYGEQAVSQIVTFGTMASKAVIRDVGRVLDMSYTFCDQLSKLIPVVQNKPMSLAKAREAEPLLREREEREDEVRALLALAAPLEDLARNVGMHAGGVLIAPGRLIDFCPLYKAPGTDSVVSQFDKDDVEAVGLVKFDFLGLRNLTTLQLALEYVNARNPGLGLDLSTLAFDDPAAYKVLRDANTNAIFQLESDGMKKLLRKLQPDRFEDIIAALALYRPGPLGSGMVEDFVLRKKGEQRIDYFHPDLRTCLEPTYGVIVYQEQVMQIAQTIGGYTLGAADLLRRAMGKKKPEEMAKHRDVFVDGALAKGYTAELANRLFDLMAMFAEYGFNKSHTAAYAVITYHTAWLKAHYPAEFLAATLSSEMGDTDKVQMLVGDARANGLRILGPDVNTSGLRFEPVAQGAIRYGLGAVKGSGASAVLSIVNARRESAFSDLFDFCARIDRRQVNRRAVEALVRAGAFDSIDPDRAKLLANVGNAMEAAEARAAAADQVGLFDEGDGAGGAPVQWLKSPGWTDRQRLLEEKGALGFFLSGHLFSDYVDEVNWFARTRLAQLQPSPQPVWIAGIVAAQRTQMSRRGKMALLTLDDGTAAAEITIYNELFERHRATIRGDELLVVLAKVSSDEYNGGLRVVAERLLGLVEARREFGKRLRIQLNGLAEIRALRSVIEPHVPEGLPGAPSIPVVVEYGNDEASCTVELGEQWRVNPDDDLISEALARLHARLVKVEY